MVERGTEPEGEASVFISYASQDAAIANALVDALERAGLKCWIAPRDVIPGAQYADEIVRAINESKVLVLVLSERAAASAHVSREIERAASKRRRILVLRTDAFPLPRAFEYFLSESQWIEVGSGGVEAAAAKLAEAVRQHLMPASAVEGLTQPSPSIPDRKVGAARRHRILLIAGVVVAIAAAYFVLNGIGFKRHSVAQQTTAAAPSTVADKSIAILPFTDLSEKKDQEYFADGIAEEVLDRLAKVPGLRIVGRTSSFQFKAKTEDIRAIGHKLGAAYIVEGSVRKSGDRVRVTTQLIDARTGVRRWSETYDRSGSDVLRVQDDIAMGLARALQLEVNGIAPLQPSPVPSNSEAYDLLLRGLHAMDTTTREGCQQAVELFNQVLRLEPESERALVAVAWAHDCLGWEDWASSEEGFPKASEYANKILLRNPRSAVAHVILADRYIGWDFDWGKAKSELDLAVGLAAPTSEYRQAAARLAQATGQFELAVELLDQAMVQDPLNPILYDMMGDTLLRLGRFQRAEDWYRKCLQVAPNYGAEHFFVSVALLLQGKFPESLAEAQAELPEEGGEAARAMIYYAMHKRPESDAALRRLLALNSKDWPSQIARVYAFRREPDQALQWLERALQTRDVDLYFIKGDPQLKNLEGDPRYRSFLRKMNLPE